MQKAIFRTPLPTILLGAVSALSAPAMAQDASDPYSGTVYDGDYLAIGAGGAYGPSYEGSDNYIVYPVGAIQGEVSGIAFRTEGPGLYVDIAPDTDGAKVDLVAGPLVRVNLNRTDRDDIEDKRVAALGKLDTAIEVGGELGFQVNRMFNPYDSMTFTIESRWDIDNAHDGRIISPQISYFTPLSEAMAGSLSLSAEHMDDDYADYYFSIDAAGALASGLPAYQANSGWKSAGANLFLAYDLGGNLSDGGFSIFANGSYKRLFNDAKNSPVTSVAGDADQWLGVLGVGYTF